MRWRAGLVLVLASLLGFCERVAEVRADETCYDSYVGECADPKVGPEDPGEPVDDVPVGNKYGGFPIKKSVGGGGLLALLGLIATWKLRKTRGDDIAPREEMLR